MKLETRNGNLTLGSAYKLTFAAWCVGIGGFFLFFFLLMVAIFFITALAGGPVMVNGEVHTGAAAMQSLLAFVPMLILLPLIIVMQGAMFSGLMVLGLLVYRQFRPIQVSEILETGSVD